MIFMDLPAKDIQTGPPGSGQQSKPTVPGWILRLYALHAASLMEKKKLHCVGRVS